MSRTLRTEPELERAYLGSLIHFVNVGDYDGASEAALLIDPQDFHDQQIGSIFTACRRLLDRGEPFDQTLLISEINGTVENPGALIYEACLSVSTTVHITGYANVIRQAAYQRRAVCVVQDSLNDLRMTAHPGAAIANLRSKLDQLTTTSRAAEPITTEPYKPFPIDTLPGAIGDYVGAAAHAIGCDPSFTALPLLGCLARAVGNKRVIRLKRTWTEPAIIWGAIVGKSGTHKTPALQSATSFLQQKQSEAITAYQESLVQFGQDKALYDRDYAAWKRSKSTEPPPWEPQTPICERFVTTDITIEALAALLATQYDGVLVTRDELAGWLGGIAEYKGGKGSDLGHWLASWSAAPLTVDRKTGVVKMLHVPRAAVSIVGGIQPGVLRTAVGHEHMQDGLCARLLLAMPDPKPVKWTDTIIDPHIEAGMSDVFDRLLGMSSGADGDGNPEPYAMPLTPEAKAVWVDYYDRHRAELAELDDDLAAAWSKLEAYAARFALIFQLCSWAAGEADDQDVDEASIRSGITLSDWFGHEAKRVYALFCETAADRDRRELVELIRRRGGRITSRDLMHASRKYQPTDVAESLLEDVVKAGLGHWRVEATGGRPKRVFILLPVSPLPEANEPRGLDAFGYGDNGNGITTQVDDG